MNLPGATTKVATLKKALSEAEDKAAKERLQREKQEARVGGVQQELEALAKKHESLQLDSKMRESELAQALESARSTNIEAHKAPYPNPKHSRSIRIFAPQCVGCRNVLPGRGGKLNGEVVLVPIYWDRTPVPMSDQLKQLVELHKAAE